MKKIFSHPVTAIAAGLLLRLYLVLAFPASAGDTVLYDEMAFNWLKHGTYALTIAGKLTPVDMRVPGYPAFLALVYLITGRAGDAAHQSVMFAQILVDLLGCVAIAAFAAALAPVAPYPRRRRIFRIALWLAALCPFTADYTAVPLTEVFAVLCTAAALWAIVRLLPAHWQYHANSLDSPSVFRPLARLAFLAGLFSGLGALFRPETPLLLLSVYPALFFFYRAAGAWKRGMQLILISGFACLLPLVPWTIRNAITFHELQPLSPKYSTMPGELVPRGFMAWEKTWLYRVRDCYLVPWKLNDEAINIDDIPPSAFDSPEERQRVASLLGQYNDDTTLSAAEDDAFGEIARERTARHPLRRYLWLPIARAFVIWFTPRIELLPYSGDVFPLAQAWEDDPVDQSVTIAFTLLNVIYVAVALWGAVLLWRRVPATRSALILLSCFVLIRTAFLTTLETPEPRYVLECFPVILALCAYVLSPPKTSGQAGPPPQS